MIEPTKESREYNTKLANAMTSIRQSLESLKGILDDPNLYTSIAIDTIDVFKEFYYESSYLCKKVHDQTTL